MLKKRIYPRKTGLMITLFPKPQALSYPPLSTNPPDTLTSRSLLQPQWFPQGHHMCDFRGAAAALTLSSAIPGSLKACSLRLWSLTICNTPGRRLWPPKSSVAIIPSHPTGPGRTKHQKARMWSGAGAWSCTCQLRSKPKLTPNIHLGASSRSCQPGLRASSLTWLACCFPPGSGQGLSAVFPDWCTASPPVTSLG